MTDWRKISVSPEYASPNVGAPCQPCQPEKDQTCLSRLSRCAEDPNSPGPPVGDDPATWKDAFEERGAIREVDGLYPRAEAEVLAFGELVNQWHFQKAVIVDGECAGCRRRMMPGDDSLRLADGADVHFGCVREYGLRWRKNASDALTAARLTIPEGWTI